MSEFFGALDRTAWLGAAVLAAVLLWVFARIRARITRTLVGPPLLARMIVDVDHPRRRTKAIVLVIALLLLGVTMMRPQWGVVFEKVERKGIDIIFVVDLSRSMLADDVKPNRLQRVTAEIKHFVESTLVSDRIGLIAFAGVSHVQCPLTHDYGAFRLFLDDLDPRIMPRGGTAIEDAMYRAIQAFPDEERNHKAIVLFTDGEDTDGDPQRAAQEAAKRNIRVFCVGIGSPEGSLIPIPDGKGGVSYLKDSEGQVVKSRLDESTLEKVALATNGAYQRLVGGQDTLGDLYTEARKIEGRSLESAQEKRQVDRFQWFAAAALLLLAIEAALPESRRRTFRVEDRRHAA